MPRLTDHTYLLQHHQLREYWRSPGNLFFLLSAREQWDLYAFYFPHETFSDDQLLAARRQMTSIDPSLPQRAGRAFSRLSWLSHAHERYLEAVARQPKRKKGAEYQVQVFGEVHPEIDIEKFAKILIHYPRRDDDEASRDEAA